MKLSGGLLLIIVNLAIMAMLLLTSRLLGFESYFDGTNYTSLLGFAAILGFGGAFISLFLSKYMAKKLMNVRIITQPVNDFETWYIETIRKLAKKAKIKMPEVGIYSGEANAFATGPTPNNALIAISTGLRDSMNRDEIEGVLAHEIAHAANGDMVTQTLLQGVMNTLVVFLARILGSIVDKVVFKNENGQGIGYYIVTIIAEIILGILAALIVSWFSRHREYKADEGSASLSSPEKMIAALQKLKTLQTGELPEEMKSFGINGSKSKLLELLSTHPSLDNRIKNIQSKMK